MCVCVYVLDVCAIACVQACMCWHVRMVECVYVHVYVYSLCEEIVGATFFCITVVIHDYMAADHPMDGQCY